MKQLNTLKGLLLATCIGTAGAASAQFANTIHPNAFTHTVGATTFDNWYKDYIGMRLQVTQPTSIAGDNAFTTANDGSGTGTPWGGYSATPIVDVPVYMGSLGAGSGDDSFACGAFSSTAAANMLGKIAVIWRGPHTVGGTPCYFSDKAIAAQTAGAIAVVIINDDPGAAPIGMGTAPGYSGSVTIPVFMIGNADGIKIAAKYRELGSIPGTVKMSITTWGKSLGNDLGFVPSGVATWHNGAIPAKQLTASPLPVAYKAMDGAFIANYGLHQSNNVKLNTQLTFTPNGSSTPSTIHTSTLTVMPTATSDTFNAVDSIYYVGSNAYDLSGSGLGTQGRYDITYNITSDSSEQFAGDNTYTHSFYATDSIYCKGRYDFVNKHPVATQWLSTTPAYLWGVPYFVAKGGDAVKDIQFSISTGIGNIASDVPFQNFYIFKWTDGRMITDSIIESGELDLVGTASYVFGPDDSSSNFFTTNIASLDTTFDNTNHLRVVLQDNSWYVVAAEITGGISAGTTTWLGCDGFVSQYPRSLGLHNINHITEIYDPLFGGDKATLQTDTMFVFSNWTFSGSAFDLDSVTYSTQKGLIPAIAMRVMPYDPATVKNTATTIGGTLNVFPNPANEQLNVAVNLDQQAKEVTFTIIDALAHVVIKETTNNVKSDKFSFNTSKLSSGNYFLIVNADGKQAYKKFAIVK